jgi:hypothetical protein
VPSLVLAVTSPLLLGEVVLGLLAVCFFETGLVCGYLRETSTAVATMPALALRTTPGPRNRSLTCTARERCIASSSMEVLSDARPRHSSVDLISNAIERKCLHCKFAKEFRTQSAEIKYLPLQRNATVSAIRT